MANIKRICEKNVFSSKVKTFLLNVNFAKDIERKVGNPVLVIQIFTKKRYGNILKSSTIIFLAFLGKINECYV